MRFLFLAPCLCLVACSSDEPEDATGDDDDDNDDGGYVEVEPGPVSALYTAETTTFEGFDVVQHLPDDLQGLAFVFHGSGGDPTVITAGTEVIDVLNRLSVNGVGFVATASTDRSVQGRWNVEVIDADANEDIARLSRMRDAWLDDGTMTEDTPIYAIGLSNGAAFSATFGQAVVEAGWPVAGMALHAGSISAAVGARSPEIPAFFVTMANDLVVDNGNTQVAFDDLNGRGVRAELHLNPEIPLATDRFTRIGGIDAETSEAVFDEFVELDVIEADGTRLVPLQDAQDLLAVPIDLPQGAIGFGGQIARQMEVVWALHAFSGSFAEEEARFLLDAD